MAFKLKKDDTFKCKVKVFTPSATRPDKHDEEIFTAEFKRIPEEDIKNYDEESDLSLLDVVFVGFEDVEDENGEVTCNEESLRTIKNDQCASAALIATYIKKIKGRNLKIKN